MDVRLSPEQQALRDSVAQVADRLGPKAVGQLDDGERAAKLEAAVTASGWRDLRTAEPDGSPLASGVEAAIVAEELGRGLVDAPFLGPTLAAELRRLAGAHPGLVPETIAVDGRLAALATSPARRRPAGRCGDRRRPRGGGRLDGARRSARARRWHRCRSRGASVPEPTDLTRPSAVAAPSTRVVEVADQTHPLTGDDIAAWTALGLALTCADLVGTMRGAVELACEYAASRRQYGAAIGSFQAVQHLLADAFVAMEGSRSVALHAAWAVDALPPDDCARRGRGGQGLLRPSGARGVRGGHPGARRHRQHLGLPGPRAPPAGAAVERPVRRRGDEPGAGARPPRDRSWPWTSVTHPTRPSSASGCGTGCGPTTRACPPRRPTTSTGPAWPPGTGPCTSAGFFGMSWPKAIGGQELPSVYDVILDEELAAAGAPPRPSLGYLVEGILAHANADIQRALPARHRQRARALVPGLQRARRRLRPGRRCAPGPTATAMSS